LVSYAGDLFVSEVLAPARDSFRLEYLFALAANNMTPSPIKTPMTIPYVNGASPLSNYGFHQDKDYSRIFIMTLSKIKSIACVHLFPYPTRFNGKGANGSGVDPVVLNALQKYAHKKGFIEVQGD